MLLGIFQSEEKKEGWIPGRESGPFVVLGLAVRSWCCPRELAQAGSAGRAWRSGLFFCRLSCRVTCAPAFSLSASVSRDLWSGLYSVGFRVAWLVVRPLCHWAVVIAGATTFATAALVALFIAGAALWIYNPILTRLIGRK